MGRTSDAGERIVEAAAELFHAGSFESVTTAEICRRAGVHPGSLYHFFSGKEELAVAVLELQWRRMRGRLLEPALHGGAAPLARLHEFLTAATAMHHRSRETQGGVFGCPIGNLAVELGTLSPDLRARVGAIFSEWVAAIADVLREAEQAGGLREGLDPQVAALMVVSQVEGALVLAKGLDDLGPLDAVAGQLVQALERTPA